MDKETRKLEALTNLVNTMDHIVNKHFIEDYLERHPEYREVLNNNSK